MSILPNEAEWSLSSGVLLWEATLFPAHLIVALFSAIVSQDLSSQEIKSAVRMFVTWISNWVSLLTNVKYYNQFCYTQQWHQTTNSKQIQWCFQELQIITIWRVVFTIYRTEGRKLTNQKQIIADYFVPTSSFNLQVGILCYYNANYQPEKLYWVKFWCTHISAWNLKVIYRRNE